MIHGSSNQIKVQNMVIENSTRQNWELNKETEDIMEEQARQKETVNYHIDRVDTELKKLIELETKNAEDLENIADEVDKC